MKHMLLSFFIFFGALELLGKEGNPNYHCTFKIPGVEVASFTVDNWEGRAVRLPGEKMLQFGWCSINRGHLNCSLSGCLPGFFAPIPSVGTIVSGLDIIGGCDSLEVKFSEYSVPVGVSPVMGKFEESNGEQLYTSFKCVLT